MGKHRAFVIGDIATAKRGDETIVIRVATVDTLSLVGEQVYYDTRSEQWHSHYNDGSEHPTRRFVWNDEVVSVIPA